MVGVNRKSSSGVRNNVMGKYLLFKPSKIKDISYTAGSHACSIVGDVIKSSARVLLKHM
jgi:hypothetical protein